MARIEERYKADFAGHGAEDVRGPSGAPPPRVVARWRA
jgi:hypothetical protein